MCCRRGAAIEGRGNAKNHDYIEWEACPVSEDYQLTQRVLRISKVRDLKNVKSRMEDKNIKLIIDSKGFVE